MGRQKDMINYALIVFMTVAFSGSIAFADVLKGDLDEDGFREHITFIKRPAKEDSIFHCIEGTIHITSKAKTCSIKIGTIEFSDMASMGLIRMSNKKLFIGIFAFGGVHSEWLYLYSFDGSRIKEEARIFSDAPSIEIKDINHDGVKEILAKHRDYEKNPIINSYIKIYKFPEKRE